MNMSQSICIVMECAQGDQSLQATFCMLSKVDIQEQAKRMAEAARAGRRYDVGTASYGKGKGGPQGAAERVGVMESSTGVGHSAQCSRM